MTLDLAAAFVTVFALSMYVLLDGFDLGVGAMLLLSRDEELRDRMVSAIAPTWDGNETWLILAGVCLLAAFPLAYSVLLPAFYLPLLVMLMALGCRGVSMEFRFQTDTWRGFWDKAFAIGSIVAALAQGFVLGAAIEGVSMTGNRFSGSVADFLGPYPALVALTVLFGYGCSGAAWLNLKGDGDLKSFAVKAVRVATPLFGVLALFAFAGAAMVQPGIGAAWARYGTLLALLGCVFVGMLAMAWTSASGQKDGAAFVWVVCALVVVLIGLLLCTYPTIIPFRVSIEAASSPTRSDAFLLTDALIVVPVILAYTFYGYRVFKGKVTVLEEA
jgi:cytochrome bd ubiquinol oxidase subunit II